MVRGKKTRRNLNPNSPKLSPSAQDNKRLRHTRTLDGFLSLASDNEDEPQDVAGSDTPAVAATEQQGASEPRSDGTDEGVHTISTAAADDDAASVDTETTIPMGNESVLTKSTSPNTSTTSSTLDDMSMTLRMDGAQEGRMGSIREVNSPFVDKMTEVTPRREHHQTNLSALIPLRPYTQRWSLRISVKPSKYAEKELIEELRRIVGQLKAIDSSFLIYRWADNDETAANISSPQLLPNTIGRLRHYFPRLTPRDAGGDVYTSLRFGTMQSWTDFRNAANPWLQQHRHGLWPCAVQAENTKCVGWLLYSTRDLDLAAMKEELERQTKHEIGLRWRPIVVGRPMAMTDRPRAVHIEVDKSVETTVTPIIRALYSSSATYWPRGVRMRLVPELGVHMSNELRTKVERLRIRQLHFTAKVVRIQNWEMAALDFRLGASNYSLRELLMALPSRTRPSLSLFHSIDQQWKGAGHTFTVLPIMEEEARTTIAGLLPFLRAKHPDLQDYIDRSFTTSAVERANQCRWDLVSHSLITEDDAVIDDVLDDMDEFLLEDDVLPQGEIQTQKLITDSTGLNLLGGDTDSVSTLPSKRAPRTNMQPTGQERIVEPITTHLSTSPPASTISSLTVEERVQSLARSVALSVANIMEQLQLIRQEQGKPKVSMVGHQEKLAMETDPPEGIGPGP